MQNWAETGRPLVVLAVEDDALVLMNTAAMLEDLGHSVLEATSGDAALEILHRESDIDLVITGTHGRRGILAVLLGSVAEDIIRTAPCDVLAVPVNFGRSD